MLGMDERNMYYQRSRQHNYWPHTRDSAITGRHIFAKVVLSTISYIHLLSRFNTDGGKVSSIVTSSLIPDQSYYGEHIVAHKHAPLIIKDSQLSILTSTSILLLWAYAIILSSIEFIPIWCIPYRNLRNMILNFLK